MNKEELEKKYNTSTTEIRFDRGFISGNTKEEPTEDELRDYVENTWGREIEEIQIDFIEDRDKWYWCVDTLLDNPED